MRERKREKEKEKEKEREREREIMYVFMCGWVCVCGCVCVRRKEIKRARTNLEVWVCRIGNITCSSFCITFPSPPAPLTVLPAVVILV